MKFNRRELLAGAAALTLMPHDRAEAWFHHGAAPTGPVVPTGWSSFPIGGGGYVINVDCPLGLAAGAICTTDVNGAFQWDNTNQVWKQLFNLQSLGYKTVGGTDTGAALGCVQSPSEPTTLYAIYWNQTYHTIGSVSYDYQVYVNVNGAGWKTNTSFILPSDQLLTSLGIIGELGQKFCHPRIAIDPINPNVVYAGAFDSAAPNGISRASNGKSGTTMTMGWVSSIPAAKTIPGTVGIIFDKSSGTATPAWCSPQTVTARLLFAVAGVGLYESTDGGDTFTLKTSDATPSTNCSYTTTQANDYLVIQVWCYGLNTAKSVTNVSGPSTLTWIQRGGPICNVYGQGTLYEYYAKAPNIGTYVWTVDYSDGCESYLTGTAVATCTLGNIVNNILTVDASSAGTWALGDAISDGNYIQSGAYISETHTENPSRTGTGGAGTYTINCNQTMPFARTINAYTRTANQVGVMAFTGADQTTPFPVTAVANQQYDIGKCLPIILPSGNYKVFTCTFSAYASADTGFSLLASNDTTVTRYAEISTAVVGAGTYFGSGSVANTYATGFITDAIAQASGGTLALDGTPVAFISNASPRLQPVNITNAQMDASGNYYFIDGPSVKMSGSVWRYLKGGAIAQIDGYGTGSGTWGSPVGWVSNILYPNSVWAYVICVDPRSGHEGSLTIQGDTNTWRGWQTTNGTAAPSSVVWVGSNESSGLTTHVSSPLIGWQPGGPTTTSGYALGDTKIDPVDGSYIQSNGFGMLWYPATHALDLDDNAFSCYPTVITQGIDELLIQDFLAPPGGSLVLVGAEDVTVLLTNLPSYPYKGGMNGDSDCWGMDFAANATNYIAAYVTGQVTPNLSSYSTDYGATWTLFSALPPYTKLGGCIAVGSYTNSTTANMVIIPGTDNAVAVTPIYSIDNGGSWHACSAPNAVYVTNKEIPYRCLAADRVNAGTFYLWAPATVWNISASYAPGNVVAGSDGFIYTSISYNLGNNPVTDGGVNWTDSGYKTGFYKSTDNGATFSQPSPGLGGLGGGQTFVHTELGNAGYVWVISSSSALYFSSNAGTNFTAVSGVSQVQLLGIGKSNQIYIYGIVSGQNSGNPGYFTSTDRGVTWTLRGTDASVPPNQSSKDPGVICGDYNVTGRFYVSYNASGGAIYNP
jgi:hypothetical protein